MIEPALREKKRYVVFEVSKEKTAREVRSKLYKEALAFLGEKGLGEMGLMFLPEYWDGRIGVIRVNHKKVNELKMVLGLIKGMETKTIKTTGSLKKTKKIIKENK
jgi:RNase P/RNase MRP subunit POP5